MDIETTKLELIHLLLQTENESILKKLKSVFEEEKGDWWDEMSEKEKEEIKTTGLSQADDEDYKASELVMKRFDKWR
ncbi:hypothetical protein [Psychroflexus halocasei]|uniref:Uncharacterized protein n=1 Tax=Psychroflexus halocasei TaxID=908615 RepID=A0A1H4B456_9FLAO|nr:hypothetical protein [Psychroflexus halocasei]SEA42995.1 hypothetical protein SAMN05421540_105258 [Psychroflexus halocasei]